jgi:AGZA family xanthine/uracil permease-like MFS transporter
LKPYHWATAGDVNAFFGLMLDNLANLLLTVSLLSAVYNFPATFALRYMLPGTAIGVVVGDLAFTWMAFRLARRSGRNDITAMPLGLDTPSTFGMVFFVLGPAFSAAKLAGHSPEMSAYHTWQVGICAIVASGILKLFCALGSSWIRRTVPRAGLLGSLAAIALVIISFMPLVEMLHYPVVGFVSLGIILTTLVARVHLPGRLPGAAGALLVGGAIYYAMQSVGLLEPEGLPIEPAEALWPSGWLEAFQFGWVGAWRESAKYLPVVIPFALATVVGGIDCTESAAAAGDEYHTGRIIAVEGLATLVAGVCGGVIQTTPYIGHPAYKAMGGRAAYTLATALFIGSAGLLGYFGYLYAAIPRPAVFPILIFVGLEITAQSFHATPRRHYAAVAMACAPAMATLVMIFADQLLDAGQLDVAKLEAAKQLTLAHSIQTMRMLSGGFIITSLLWAATLAMLVDRRLHAAAGYLAVGAVCSLFGVIHSPLRGSPLALPWDLPQSLPASAETQTPLAIAASYAALAILLAVWGLWVEPSKMAESPLQHENA